MILLQNFSKVIFYVLGATLAHRVLALEILVDLLCIQIQVFEANLLSTVELQILVLFALFFNVSMYFTGNNGKETISFVLGLKKCRNILTSVNLAKVHQSGNLLKVFGSNLRVGLIFGKILSPLLRFFNDIGYIFIVTKGQYGKINVAIWSHRY